MPTSDPALSGLALRSVDPQSPDLHAWVSSVGLVFKDTAEATPERTEFRREGLRTHRLSGAYDGDQIVGTYRSWDIGLTLPGGTRTTANAISSVTVRPTHRRRGVLTALIAADLRAAAERELAVAILIASQAPIYGRYGFGPSTETARWSIELSAARVRPEVPRSGRIEFVPEAQAQQAAPEVFERARRAGAIDRTERRWAMDFGTLSLPGDTRTRRLAAVHSDDDGRPQGYVQYRVEESWVDRECRTAVHVEDLQAATPQAYAALWAQLLELDTVARVEAEDRAVDEALPWLLTDWRAARQRSRSDFQWCRLLDVPAALSSRRYESPGSAVFEVADADGFTAGRYRLEAAADGKGTCSRTDADPDVRLPVDVLSSLWLGGGDLRAAATAGRAAQERPGGLDRLARLLATTRAPWTNTWF